MGRVIDKKPVPIFSTDISAVLPTLWCFDFTADQLDRLKLSIYLKHWRPRRQLCHKASWISWVLEHWHHWDSSWFEVYLIRPLLVPNNNKKRRWNRLWYWMKRRWGRRHRNLAPYRFSGTMSIKGDISRWSISRLTIGLWWLYRLLRYQSQKKPANGKYSHVRHYQRYA